jgi:hypothetical protein
LPFLNRRISYGVWGSGLFQSNYENPPSTLQWLPMMPEWYLVVLSLAALSALGLFWWPLRLVLPLFVIGAGIPTLQTAVNVAQVVFPRASGSRVERLRRYGLTTLLFVMQPLVRLVGRLHYGLTPWWRRTTPDFALPRPRRTAIWSERWRSAKQWLGSIEEELFDKGAVVARGGDSDRWDLEVRGGLFGGVRMHMAIEEHGGGKQLVRLRSWPRIAPAALGLTVVFALLAAWAAIDQAWLASAILGVVGMLLGILMFGNCVAATASVLHTLGMCRPARQREGHCDVERQYL